MGRAAAPAHRAVICDCCGRTVDYVRGSLWHGDARVCRACFYLWYEGGPTDPAELGAEVRRRAAAREWPFDDSIGSL